MIVFIKKWNLVMLICIAVFSCFCIKIYFKPITTSIELKPIEKIVLDAGHGSPDGGAVGVTGVLEKDVNLKIAQKLKAKLEKNNVQVVMTRETDEGIHDPNLKTTKEKKRSDMNNRKKIIESTDADLFISIHANKFPESKYYGSHIFYANTEESKEIALRIDRQIKADIQPDNKREPTLIDKSIYLFKNPKYSSVLVETGFLSNQAEEKLLSTDEYQEKMADSICAAILNIGNE